MKEEKKELKKLTRRTKEYIKEAIDETKSRNRYDICENISLKLEEKFSGNILDYQLKRMDLKTTKQILEAIDTYMYKYAKYHNKVNKKNKE